MKNTFIIYFLSVISTFSISSCDTNDFQNTLIPDIIIYGDAENYVYDTVFTLNATELTEGLTGFWKVLESNDSYLLSNPLNPNCQLIGKYRGEYKLRWTVTNGIDEKYEDVYIKMFKKIPEKLIEGPISFQILADTVRLNAIELTEGLTARWEVIHSNSLSNLSDFEDPKSLFRGELLGYYKLRWTVSNGKETKYEDIEINIAGFIDARDNIAYKAVKIGDQIWMAENLKATSYTDKTPIPLITNNEDWANLSTPGFCWNQNDSLTYAQSLGAIYNYHTVNTGNLCPVGWHVPSDEEWTILSDFLGGDHIAGGKLKEKGTSHWFSPNTWASNETSFNALPTGTRSNLGEFKYIGKYGYWWSSTELSESHAIYRDMRYDNSALTTDNRVKEFGFYVRCIKDCN